MNDYIKRGYAKTAICSSCANPCSLAEKANNPCVTVIELARIPSADVAPVRHGRWEDEFKEDAEAFMKHRYVCTVCGKWQTYGKTQYCPNCGSKMDKGE